MANKIIIAGGRGFVGSRLSEFLLPKKYEVIILTRNFAASEQSTSDSVKYVKWDAQTSDGWLEYAENATAIINLAGENIGSGLWTARKKKRILNSRLNAGKAITDAVKKANSKPKVVIQASGIGYYGNTGDRIVDESSPNGTGFLADIGREWEQSVQEVNNYDVRLAILRFGVVLGKDGGFLDRATLPFRFFIGGHLGSGEQWISWIHIEDLVRIIEFMIQKENLEGIYNVTSPDPVKSKQFFRTIGKVMQRPSIFPVPSFILKIVLGEMANELILSGQRVSSKKLLDANYQFVYEELNDALKDILEEN